MKKHLWKLLFLLALSVLPLHAQSTTVSGTITDANGQVFANGTYKIQFNPNGVAPPFQWNGSPFTPSSYIFTGSLNSSGAFSGVSVPSNTYIAPGTLWAFTVCPASSSPCYSQSLVVSGATQSVSSSMVPPAIVVNASSNNQTAYSDSEIVGPVVGFQYFNLTSQVVRVCTVAVPCTWVNGGGGGGGSGTVTSFSAGNLSPLFTSSVATATTTPALTFTLSTAGANTVFGNFTGSTGAPTFTAAPTFSAANLTNFPTFNQNTTGNAATATNISTNGTANQVWGMNSGGSAQGWQTVSSGAGTVTVVGAGSLNSTALMTGGGTTTAQTPCTTCTLSSGGALAGLASLATVTDGTHPSSVQLAGNSTLPSLTANTVTILGPPSASPTAWSLQVPTAIPTTTDLFSCVVTGTNCLLMDTGIASGNVVTLAGTQTLTNKTISGAAISAALTGTGAYIPVTLLNSGTSASSSTFWRGDGTWATPPGGAGGLVQVPATTAANTIAPTANGVVGLTILATTGSGSPDQFDVGSGGSSFKIDAFNAFVANGHMTLNNYLLVNNGGGGGGALYFSNNGDHFDTNGSASNDHAGTLTIAAATNGTVTKSFSTAYGSAPACVVSGHNSLLGGATSWNYTESTTALVISQVGVSTSTTTYDYECNGNPN